MRSLIAPGVPAQPAQPAPGVPGRPAGSTASNGRRHFRWVARPPQHGPGVPHTTPGSGLPSEPGPTPRYRFIPRWGLVDLPTQPPAQQTGMSVERVAQRLLMITAALFLFAAAAEFSRYLILLDNRSRLIQPLVVGLSDVAVWASSWPPLGVALAAAWACARWLIEARRSAFAGIGRSDPRSASAMMAGCLVPLLNLIAPGVLLTELARLRTLRMVLAVRIWWCAWVFSAIMSAVAVCWRFAHSLQLVADGVMVTMWTDLVAACVAVSTLWVIREEAGHNLFGRVRTPTRLVPAVGPVEPVIPTIQKAPPVASLLPAEKAPPVASLLPAEKAPAEKVSETAA